MSLYRCFKLAFLPVDVYSLRRSRREPPTVVHPVETNETGDPVT